MTAVSVGQEPESLPCRIIYDFKSKRRASGHQVIMQAIALSILVQKNFIKLHSQAFC